MADCISFSKKYLDFVCEPYKSSYASYLNAFQLIKIKDDENKEVLYKDEEYLSLQIFSASSMEAMPYLLRAALIWSMRRS